MNETQFNNFFENVIHKEDYKSISVWLKKQPELNIEMFFNSFNFRNSKDKETLVIEELNRRKNKKLRMEKWLDRILGFILGLLSAVCANNWDHIFLYFKEIPFNL